jgi:hypothetical protein
MKMSRVLRVLCVGVLWGACASGKEVYRSSGKTPNIPMLKVAGTNVLEIGTIHDCAITNVPFRLVNSGKVPVKINRLIPMCSCLTATAPTNDVPPGGEITVQLVLDPRTIKGVFSRGLWVCANDTDAPYMELTLTGKVVPIFSGVPDKPVPLKLQELGRPYTNRIALAANVPGVFLGQPGIATNSSGLAVSLSIVTNVGEKVRYEVVAVTTASIPGRQKLVVHLPVLGGLKVAPVAIRFQGQAGSNLMAVPQKIVMALGSQPQTFRILLQTGRGTKLSPSSLTWEPKREGVSISSVAGRVDSEVLVRLEVTPAAAEALFLAKGAAVQFSHPGFGSVRVPFVSELDSSRQEKRGGFKGRARRDGRKALRF